MANKRASKQKIDNRVSKRKKATDDIATLNTMMFDAEKTQYDIDAQLWNEDQHTRATTKSAQAKDVKINANLDFSKELKTALVAANDQRQLLPEFELIFKSLMDDLKEPIEQLTTVKAELERYAKYVQL